MMVFTSQPITRTLRLPSWCMTRRFSGHLAQCFTRLAFCRSGKYPYMCFLRISVYQECGCGVNVFPNCPRPSCEIYSAYWVEEVTRASTFSNSVTFRSYILCQWFPDRIPGDVVRGFFLVARMGKCFTPPYTMSFYIEIRLGVPQTEWHFFFQGFSINLLIFNFRICPPSSLQYCFEFSVWIVYVLLPADDVTFTSSDWLQCHLTDECDVMGWKPLWRWNRAGFIYEGGFFLLFLRVPDR